MLHKGKAFFISICFPENILIFFIFCTNSKNFCTKIIEAAEEKIKDLVLKKNSTRSFCNIMRLVW